MKKNQPIKVIPQFIKHDQWNWIYFVNSDEVLPEYFKGNMINYINLKIDHVLNQITDFNYKPEEIEVILIMQFSCIIRIRQLTVLLKATFGVEGLTLSFNEEIRNAYKVNEYYYNFNSNEEHYFFK